MKSRNKGKQINDKESYEEKDSFNKDIFITTDFKTNIKNPPPPTFKKYKEKIDSPYKFSPSLLGFNKDEFESNYSKIQPKANIKISKNNKKNEGCQENENDNNPEKDDNKENFHYYKLKVPINKKND